MYNYEWDIETGGYILTSNVSGVTKELRPVFYEELDLLGFNEYWNYPKSEKPLLWAETRRYIYKGRLVAEAQGGGLYAKPTLKIYEDKLNLEPVDIDTMIEKNKALITGLVQYSVGIIYKTFNEYKNKNIDVVYVAFSGGKDSIVLLDLVQRALPHNEFKVVFGDTSMEISDTYKAVERAKKRWPDLEFYTAKSHLDAKESWEMFGPPSRTQRWCCGVHKSAPSLLKLREITGKDRLRALVFDGVRAEESNARATYSVVSEGQKHSTQANCRPILNWGTCELFIYILSNDLLLNDAYRYGVIRVGCAICPMESSWWESIASTTYEKDLLPFIEQIEKRFCNKLSSANERKKYIFTGGWKGRKSGKDINSIGNKIVEQNSNDIEILDISVFNEDWKEWFKAIGNLVEIGNNKYTISYQNENYYFSVLETKTGIRVELNLNHKTTTAIRFFYLFKNIFRKNAYCNYCKVCIVECPTGALKIANNRIKIGNNCIHCEECLDKQKGCLAAKSLIIDGGENKMNNKGIDIYSHFGFRKEWLNDFFMLDNDFWSSGKCGSKQYSGFKVWLREAEITEKNVMTSTGKILRNIGANELNCWAVILINLAYNSAIINWYLLNTETNYRYTANDFVTLLGDGRSLSTRENAVTSLKETFRYSPIGTELGVGICELKGNAVVSITRTPWANPDPLVILYSLYKFAEKSDGYYRFTLSYLCDETIERAGISPTQIFGIDRKIMKDKLQSLATDYRDFISVSFSKDLDNIDLQKDKTSLDVLKLF